MLPAVPEILLTMELTAAGFEIWFGSSIEGASGVSVGMATETAIETSLAPASLDLIRAIQKKGLAGDLITKTIPLNSAPRE